MKHVSFLIILLSLTIAFTFAQATPTPTSPAPTPIPGASVGDVWIYWANTSIEIGDPYDAAIHVNTGTQRLAAYNIWLYFDPYMLSLDDVVAGADGFLSAVGAGYPGTFVIQGFDTGGTGPGSNLHILTLCFLTDQGNCGETLIDIEVDHLANEDTNTIGIPQAYDGTVVISGCITTGDVNSDRLIDIIDALLTAQYYVGLGVSINTVAADANCDGLVDIVDALLIAQYYVGLFDTLC